MYNNFKTEYLSEPFKISDIELYLYNLASKFYQITEEYDRTICTGPIINGSIHPSNGREFILINKNALKVRKELFLKPENMALLYTKLIAQ